MLHGLEVVDDAPEALLHIAEQEAHVDALQARHAAGRRHAAAAGARARATSTRGRAVRWDRRRGCGALGAQERTACRRPSPVLVRLRDATAPCLATPDAALSRRPADCMRVVRGRRQLDEELVVDARGPQGAHCASCWMELLALAAPRPLPVAPGDSLSVRLSVELDARAEVPPRYFMEGEACLRDPARQAAAAAKELMQRLTKAVSKEGKE